jgi:aminopeptidase YwaD
MRYKFFLLAAFASASFLVKAQSYTINRQQLEKHIHFLASDSLKGRYAGTAEDLVAATYIRDQFATVGLDLLFDEGFQSFEVVTSVEPGADNSLSVAGIQAVFGTNYGLYAFSSNATVEAEVVFAGFGMVIETDELQHNDYEDLDVEGKWVLVLKGDPEPDSNESPYIPYADARSKALYARDQGAAGLLLLGGEKNSPGDEAAPFVVERSVVNVGLPVIDLRKAWADSVLLQIGPKTDSLEVLMLSGKKPIDYMVSPLVTAKTSLVQNRVTTFNIAAMRPGDDSLLKDECIIIGAHYDHLGMGGPGSGSRHPDTIAPHYGADDNASGVAGVMEMAAYFADPDNSSRRSIIFAAFGAEELGLLGSLYFANNPPVEKEQMVAMLNFDMIGRLNSQKAVAVAGTGTALETEDLLSNLSKNSALSLSYSPEGFGASDHSSFYAKDIPVMFFSTGAHPDYHTPLDTYDRINFSGMAEVLGFVASVATELGNMPDKLSFREAGPRERQRSSRGFKVTLGIMPDFTASGGEGLPVGGVTKGGPADGAGMMRGDVIVAVNGLSVGDIYDYMNRLKQLKRGERANVDIIRNGEKMVLIVDL